MAWRGEADTYTDEAADQLRTRVGEGITGWVAQHGVAQYLPDAMADPRGSARARHRGRAARSRCW